LSIAVTGDGYSRWAVASVHHVHCKVLSLLLANLAQSVRMTRKEKACPFDVTLIRSQAFYRAAQHNQSEHGMQQLLLRAAALGGSRYDR